MENHPSCLALSGLTVFILPWTLKSERERERKVYGNRIPWAALEDVENK
jgi:hypothetical protein